MDPTWKLIEGIGKSEAMAIASAVVPMNALGALSVADPIPDDVLRLLWFCDGPLKNSDPTASSTSFASEQVVVHASYQTTEPSAISVHLPVASMLEDEASIPDPSYFPRYDGMTPQQRRKYLGWLTNVDRNIYIGYVFVFYYGLERHLFFGRVDEAFDMVLRLRRSNANRSFAHYSNSALIASAMRHNRPDLFTRYLDEVSCLGPPQTLGLYLLAKAVLSMPLTPGEIIFVSREVGFTNPTSAVTWV